MAAATIQDLRELHGGLSAESDELLQRALFAAQRTVSLDSFALSEPDFSLLQLFYASHLLQLQGVVEGPLAGRSIADLSWSYRSSGSTDSSSWLDEYRSLRGRIHGFRGRLA